MDASVSPQPVTTPSPSFTLVTGEAKCETTISVGGVLYYGPGQPLTTLTHAAILETPCAPGQTPTATPIPILLANQGVDNLDIDSLESGPGGRNPQFSDFRDPFYASTFPVCYVLAATTVTAYMLVIMLFITPRSFLDGGIVYLGRRGFTGNSSGGGGIRIGGRPWLQKVAAMTVAISLTIATADTFRVAEEQYSWGVQNADRLQVEVMDSTELKVIRLVSDTFLWLAQAQTLIRLFPRQREKVIIKWTAFALITLQVIFSALNSFYYTTSGSQGNMRPQSFVNAVPALSYLFHLSLGLLYAAWVIYYALMKKRYAFYHPLMKNMALVSTLSLISILVPVVFFILDISRPEFIGWGDYVRWVGAAAASVVVWEWVERIEALEREEKKDGILGREVFDGDEMAEASPSEFPWLRRRKNGKGGGHGGGGGGGGGDDRNGGFDGGQGTSTAARLITWPGLTSIPPKYQGNFQQEQQASRNLGAVQSSEETTTGGGVLRPPLWPARPAPVVTPMSRTDTASAASTDYAVRYQQVSDTTGRTPDAFPHRDTAGRSRPSSRSDEIASISDSSGNDDSPTVAAPVPRQPPADTTAMDPEAQDTAAQSRSRWRSLAHAANPFFRRSEPERPPSAVAPHTEPKRKEEPEMREKYEGSGGRWDFRARLEDFAATQAEKIREKMQPTPETDSLPVTIIPAPPRQGAALAQLLEEEEEETMADGRGARSHGRPQLERRSSEASGFSNFAGFGVAATTSHGLDRSGSNWSRRSPGPSRSTDSPPVDPSRPPLWPGVRRSPAFARAAESPILSPNQPPLWQGPGSRHGSDEASGSQGRQPDDNARAPPTP